MGGVGTASANGPLSQCRKVFVTVGVAICWDKFWTSISAMAGNLQKTGGHPNDRKTHDKLTWISETKRVPVEHCGAQLD
jgi:hypothetical protein